MHPLLTGGKSSLLSAARVVKAPIRRDATDVQSLISPLEKSVSRSHTVSMKATNQKRRQSQGRKFLLGFSILLLLGGMAPERSASRSKLSITDDLPPLCEHGGSHHSRRFTCLPKDVQPGEIVSYRPKGTLNITVENKLVEMKARCQNGKLVDAKRREIRFFHHSCWGNPPPDYLDIREREDKEFAQLKKRYTVIVFGCNPMIQ
jgi:hypothetical protein